MKAEFIDLPRIVLRVDVHDLGAEVPLQSLQKAAELGGVQLGGGAVVALPTPGAPGRSVLDPGPTQSKSMKCAGPARSGDGGRTGVEVKSGKSDGQM